MRIIKGYPPNFDAIQAAFTLREGQVFAYYPDIYAPDSYALSPDLLAHEMTHLAQQKDYGVEKWWERYLEEPAFRASQEISAFQNQYQVMKSKVKDRNRLARFLVGLAGELSGETYGKCMSRAEALEAIKSGKRYAFALL